MGMLPNFTRRQWLTLIIIGLADFCNAICVSLQSPFFPKEAEAKGCTATEYGLVFGVFELVVFIISPIYGRHINKVGPKKMFNIGILTSASSSIVFGLLDNVPGHYPFILLAFVIRIVEALGNAAFLTASFSIIAKEFPNNIATTFASLETFFGLGLIAGPTVGGALYSLGGYELPFVVLGACLLLTAILTIIILPHHSQDQNESGCNSLKKIISIPGVFVTSLSIIATSSSIGFLTAVLEPHLRQFGLSPVILGLVFVINGGLYAITAPIWGWSVDKFLNPKIACLTGNVLISLGFCLVGPVWFLPLEPTLTVIIMGLVLHGFGIAAVLVATFIDALRTSFEHGYEDNIKTYGLVSGLWTSTFALGAFIGPFLSGILYDSVGFRKGVIFIIITQLLVGIITSIFLCYYQKRNRTNASKLFKELDPKEPLIVNHKHNFDSYGGTDGHDGFERNDRGNGNGGSPGSCHLVGGVTISDRKCNYKGDSHRQNNSPALLRT